MASHRLGETNLSESGPSSNHNIQNPYGFNLHGFNPSAVPNPFINQGGGSSFDFGELEEAIGLQGVVKAPTAPTTARHGYGHEHGHDESKPTQSALFTGRPAATLDMFPSWPIRFQQPDTTPRGSSRSGGGESTDSGSAVNNTLTGKAEGRLEPESPNSTKGSPLLLHPFNQQRQQHEAEMASDHNNHHHASKTGTGTSQHNQIRHASKQPLDKRQVGGTRSDKVLDAKTLRRLAQNREAAKKSRLRKKAYVQQLESSRIKLAQLEQDLQRARAQGLFMGGGGGTPNISSGAAIFDMEYSRWLEDDHRHMSELRTGLQAHLPDGDLRVIVEGYINHYDEIFRLKGVAARSDVFHLITGMWTTPAERCFLWMGGFRPSELIKMLTAQLDLLTEQQLMAIYGLQHSSQQAEEALTQGLDQLQQSLVDTIAATAAFTDGRHQMAVALGKLSNLEGFIRQADNLRQQTLHQLRRILTVRQAARCFLVIGDYYGRLRALSSLWASRPRDQPVINEDNTCQATTALQMVQQQQQQQQQQSQNHFVNF